MTRTSTNRTIGHARLRVAKDLESEQFGKVSHDGCPRTVSVLQRAYYAWRGVRQRRRAYNAAVWEEKDPFVLLLKVTPMVSRSVGASFMLMPRRRLYSFLLGYIYFRVQDTYADVCIGSEQRRAGLRLLPERLRKIMDGGSPAADDMSDYSFNLQVPRNVAYVDIVRHVQRFDEVFRSLPKWAQQALCDFVVDFSEGSIELESRADSPRTPEYLRRHTEVSIDYGLICALRLLEMDELATAVRHPDSVGDAMRAWCDWIHLGNLVSSIEQDIREGCVMDDAFRAPENLRPEVLDRVRRKWIRLGAAQAGSVAAFLLHPSLSTSYPLRMALLHTSHFTINAYDAASARCHAKAPSGRRSVYGLLLRGMLKSLTWRGYQREMQNIVRQLQLNQGRLQKEESCASS